MDIRTTFRAYHLEELPTDKSSVFMRSSLVGSMLHLYGKYQHIRRSRDIDCMWKTSVTPGKVFMAQLVCIDCATD